MACLKNSLASVHIEQFPLARIVAARGLLYIKARSPNVPGASVKPTTSPFMLISTIPIYKKKKEENKNSVTL